jgi:hypothetical protein
MSVIRPVFRIAVLASLAVSAVACGDVARSGRAPVYLVIDSIGARAGGATTGPLTSFLLSDVLTLITQPAPCSSTSPCPTIFNDSGEATFHIELKDIGSAAAPSAPTSNNQVTITRYHVAYHRADGRNSPGVDVPYGFDGGGTVTVPAGGTATLGFELVRHTAKQEAPLAQLASNPASILTLAEVTFYGSDLVGNEIQATGTIQVNFGNFADR